MIFVDTSAWYPIYAQRTESRSLVARTWIGSNRHELVTTDYVIDELLTLLRSRGETDRALVAGGNLWSQRDARIEYITQDDLAHAWQVFKRYDDKQWSFTDCTSRVVMERLGITTAFAFDDHFRQFNSVTVVP